LAQYVFEAEARAVEFALLDLMASAGSMGSYIKDVLPPLNISEFVEQRGLSCPIWASNNHEPGNIFTFRKCHTSDVLDLEGLYSHRFLTASQD
jgi:hypothetical protein